MNRECIDRFDRTAEGYLLWWAPVLEPASVRLVDRVGRADPGLPGGEPHDVIDIGCGTGNCLFEAARHWPGARLTGLDASFGMLDVARREMDKLPESARARISFVSADASAIPAPDASFDIAVTAFMLQQLPDRAPMLRELHRVLRPGGILAICGWVIEKIPFAPEVELEEALADTGIVHPPSKEVRSGHFASTESAADELRSAGFRRVAAQPDALDHPWTVEDFIAYRTTTREVDLFESLDEPTRLRAVDALRLRLSALAPDKLVYRPPTVSILARKP
jgi:SAM-dependent methyltransferase